MLCRKPDPTSPKTLPYSKGFTLVEVMAVLVILSLLIGVVTVSVRSHLIRSRQHIAKIEIAKMMEAIDQFYIETDRYPTNEEGLEILATKSEDFPDGIISFVPRDPWGNRYEYRCPGLEDNYEILSLGGDKREGGTAGDTDISSVDLKKAKRS